MFSIICQELKSEIRCFDDLFEKLGDAPITPKAEVEHFLFTWDWKTFIKPNLTNKSLENHTYYHQFQFLEEENCVKMRAKHLPQDLEWTPASGLRLVKDCIMFEPVPADEFRIEKLDLPHVFRDLNKFFPKLPLLLRMKISSSWDALRETLESLPGKRFNLEKMKIEDLPKQSMLELPSIPEEFHHVIEKEVPDLIGDIFPETLDEALFEDEVTEGLDVACYTVTKSRRPWVGRVMEVLPGGKFVINWYARKQGNVNKFYATKVNGKLVLSTQDNACVMLWGFTEQKEDENFIVSNYWLAKLKAEYETYDINEF